MLRPSSVDRFSSHDCFKTGDPDAPDYIKDGNGDVALGLCRRCGRGERELYDEFCISVKSVSEPTVTLRQGESYTLPPSKFAVSIAAVPRQHDNDNPLWRGPCGEGPLGGITQSMLVRFLSCRERFRLKYVCGLEPHDKWNHRIGYGNMWHACEEALARCSNPSGTEEAWRHGLSEHVSDMLGRYPLQREEIHKWFNVCRVQFPEYVKYWAEHPDVKNRTPLLQEQVFDVPYTLPSGRVVRLRGKWDSVDLIEPGPCECGADRSGPSAEAHKQDCPAYGPWTFRDGRWHGGIYLQENKTKGDIDKLQVERQLKFDLQTMIYLIALQEWHPTATMLLESGADPNAVLKLEKLRDSGSIRVAGVRYNVVRRPLSGGIGNIKPRAAKYTKTKVTPAETTEEFYERLRRDYLAADPDYWFFRVRVEISAKDIQVFRETCLDPLLETLCIWYEMTVGDRGFCGYSPELPPMNYRTPFGVWSALEEGGATEYDYYLEAGSEAGLRRVETLFPELQ